MKLISYYALYITNWNRFTCCIPVLVDRSLHTYFPCSTKTTRNPLLTTRNAS